ncbi:MAG: patatin-like phospholipase family protein [Actinomycetota bacterium]
MSRVGLVLGGGGITGAAFQIASLMALELACDWEASRSDVVVGTSGGAYVASLVRSGKLDLDSLVLPHEDPDQVAERIRRQIFVSAPGLHLGRWVRNGVLPSLRQPGVTALMGSPARYSPRGIAGWVREQIGVGADTWPERPTVIAAYDVSGRRRAGFGSVSAPEASLADAVAASSAIPLLFHPHVISGRAYVDGGVASGTHLDLVLGSVDPLDLIVVIAPMAAEEGRSGAWPHERLLDRVGRRSLRDEKAAVLSAWPHTEVLVLRPPPAVLAVMRPNPMAPDAAVPTFARTLIAMKRQLAETHTWGVLTRHLAGREIPA